MQTRRLLVVSSCLVMRPVAPVATRIVLNRGTNLRRNVCLVREGGSKRRNGRGDLGTRRIRGASAVPPAGVQSYRQATGAHATGTTSRGLVEGGWGKKAPLPRGPRAVTR